MVIRFWDLGFGSGFGFSESCLVGAVLYCMVLGRVVFGRVVRYWVIRRFFFRKCVLSVFREIIVVCL